MPDVVTVGSIVQTRTITAFSNLDINLASFDAILVFAGAGLLVAIAVRRCLHPDSAAPTTATSGNLDINLASFDAILVFAGDCPLNGDD